LHKLRAGEKAGLIIMDEILQYLKKHGECTDKEIARALGIPLAGMQQQLAELKDKNQIMLCHSIKFIKGKEIESIICRISGYIPPAKPGAKPKVQLTLS
jgi:transcription initiation factor IIE alpha subunit